MDKSLQWPANYEDPTMWMSRVIEVVSPHALPSRSLDEAYDRLVEKLNEIATSGFSGLVLFHSTAQQYG